MKNQFLIVFTLLYQLSLLGQHPVIKREWTSYCQYITINNSLKNKKFKLSAFIKGERMGKNSKAALWVRVDEDGFFQNDAYNENVKITEDWQKFEIKGIIDSIATELYFGAFVKNNGRYFFDDFQLMIETTNKKWEPYPIQNSDFENLDNLGWIHGVEEGRETIVQNFDIVNSKESSNSGTYSLKIEGKGIIGNNENGEVAKVNGIELYYESYGEGEPLILVHGNGQSIGAFINQVEVFAKDYRVIVLDSRGRGNSTYDTNVELTYKLQSKDLIGFMDYLALPKAHIVGWSDGGIIALITAMNNPERVDKIVAMAANIFPDGIVENRRKDIKEAISYFKSEGIDGITLDLYNLLDNYPKLAFKDLNAIKAKTLIVAGDHDVIKHQHTIGIFENIPDAQLAILPDETHYLPSENPELFNSLVKEFLSKN